MKKSKQQQSKRNVQTTDRPAENTEQGSGGAQRSSSDIEGEGSYTASKQYDESVKAFVESGKVEEASGNAEPRNDVEAREMKRAEEIGRSRAKEEDPEVSQPRGDARQKP